MSKQNYVTSVHEIFKEAQNNSELNSKIDIDDLLETVENQKNEHLINKSLEIIAKEILDELTTEYIPSQYKLSREDKAVKRRFVKDTYNKLVNYRVINEIFEIHRGKHVRWIRRGTVGNPNSGSLTTGGIVVDIKFLNTGTNILVRNSRGQFIQFKYDECIIFQILSEEERFILASFSLL